MACTSCEKLRVMLQHAEFSMRSSIEMAERWRKTAELATGLAEECMARADDGERVIRSSEKERLASWWDDTEARSAEAHAVYQQEAHRRGDVRHPDAYEDLSDATKEWDRVLVRWVASTIRRSK